MITLERFRRELGGACPEADAEALAVFEQLSIVADVVGGGSADQAGQPPPGMRAPP